jgi:hypothetical protein
MKRASQKPFDGVHATRRWPIRPLSVKWAVDLFVSRLRNGFAGAIFIVATPGDQN